MAAPQPEEFQIGGPLAGIKLPSVGQLEVELYPGAAERFRLNVGGMEFHYKMFDKQSQVKNWTAPNIPGCEGTPTGAVPGQTGQKAKAGPVKLSLAAAGFAGGPVFVKVEPVETTR